MKPAKTLRWWALFVTGVGGVVAFAMFLLMAFAWYQDSGVPIMPALVFMTGCVLVISGLLVFVVDMVLRLAGRRV